MTDGMSPSTTGTATAGATASAKQVVASAATTQPTLLRTCMSRICNREGIVWAKVYGHPAWPARLVEAKESQVEPRYRLADEHKQEGEDTLVTFFGTSEIAWVARAKAIRPWKTGLQKKFQRKGWRHKAFRRALAEARKYAEQRALAHKYILANAQQTS